MRSILNTFKLLKNPSIFVGITLAVSLFLKANDIAPTDQKLLLVLSSSGITSQYPEFIKQIENRSKYFVYMPPNLISNEIIEYNMFTFIRGVITDDEIRELYTKFKNPFFAKICKLFFMPVEDDVALDIFTRKHGKKASAKKLNLLSKINSFLKADSYLFNYRLSLEKAIKYLEIKKRPENANSDEADLNKLMNELISDSVKGMLEEHPRFILRTLYYKHRFTTMSELEEFDRRYGNDELVLKFFKLYHEAQESLSHSIYNKLLKRKDSSK